MAGALRARCRDAPEAAIVHTLALVPAALLRRNHERDAARRLHGDGRRRGAGKLAASGRAPARPDGVGDGFSRLQPEHSAARPGVDPRARTSPCAEVQLFQASERACRKRFRPRSYSGPRLRGACDIVVSRRLSASADRRGRQGARGARDGVANARYLPARKFQAADRGRLRSRESLVHRRQRSQQQALRRSHRFDPGAAGLSRSRPPGRLYRSRPERRACGGRWRGTRFLPDHPRRVVGHSAQPAGARRTRIAA